MNTKKEYEELYTKIFIDHILDDQFRDMIAEKGKERLLTLTNGRRMVFTFSEPECLLFKGAFANRDKLDENILYLKIEFVNGFYRGDGRVDYHALNIHDDIKKYQKKGKYLSVYIMQVHIEEENISSIKVCVPYMFSGGPI